MVLWTSSNKFLPILSPKLILAIQLGWPNFHILQCDWVRGDHKILPILIGTTFPLFENSCFVSSFVLFYHWFLVIEWLWGCFLSCLLHCWLALCCFFVHFFVVSSGRLLYQWLRIADCLSWLVWLAWSWSSDCLQQGIGGFCLCVLDIGNFVCFGSRGTVYFVFWTLNSWLLFWMLHSIPHTNTKNKNCTGIFTQITPITKQCLVQHCVEKRTTSW